MHGARWSLSTAHQPKPCRRGSAREGGHWDAAVDQHSCEETGAEVSERHSPPEGAEDGRGWPRCGNSSPCQERLPAFRQLARRTATGAAKLTLTNPSNTFSCWRRVMEIEDPEARCLSNPE